MKLNNKWVLALFVVFLGLNFQAFAEKPPVPSVETVQAETSNAPKAKLKAPIEVELTQEEIEKAAKEAKIKEELTEEQKHIGEAAPLKVEDNDFDPNSNEELTKEVVPNTSDEFIKLISMFARVMLAVLAASVIIYYLLLFVKKYFHPPLPNVGEEDFDVRDLNSPKNTDEALKSFLDRTGE